jgi:hypothetical protein
VGSFPEQFLPSFVRHLAHQPTGRVMTRTTSDKKRYRSERVQVFLSFEEAAALQDFRYQARMPSLQAAVRELLQRGLTSVQD